jgi:DNA repair protein SbcC/Rad50
MNLQSAREKLGQKLADVSEVAAGVLRGVRRNGQRDVAAYVFDLNNRIPETVGSLSDYLDEVMGPAYFDRDAAPDLRWNNYLYFVVDKGVAASPAFQATKQYVETDRSYARKFVVVEDELDRVLSELDSVAVVEESSGVTDVIQAWSDRLGAAGLEDVLDEERPVADVVRRVSSGTAKHSVRTKKTSGVEDSQKLVASHLSSIELTGFRPYPNRPSIGFGRANLLFGPNGVGKTSLLEGLEFLYCGGNRRSTASASATVRGLLASGQSVKTSGNQVLSDFKTRQRLWYGGDDNSRQNKLPNQFARFNFLNTDAAAELSLLKEDSNANAESLAALLSGHEATVIWRRIQDVRKAVAEEVRSKRSERAVAEADAKTKEQERRSLETAPAQSDAAFSVFKKDLERIGWRHAPEGKQAVTAQLVESLSDLASQVKIIERIEWLEGPVSGDTIAQEFSALLTASKDLQAPLASAKEDEQRRRVLAQRQSIAKSRLAALGAISPSAHAELKELSLTLTRADGELARNAPALAALPTSSPPEHWELSWGGKLVPEALSASRAALQLASQQLEEARQGLAAMTRTQSELQSAMTELHAWAQKVVDHRHSDSNCPVCGTAFPPGELLVRMQSLISVPADAAVSELRRQIEQLATHQTRTSNEATWLAQLEKFVRASGVAESTVRDAEQSALNLIERQRLLREAREAARQGIDAYARAGVSLEAIEQLCAPIEGDDNPRPATVGVLEALSLNQEFLDKLEFHVRELDHSVQQRDRELRLRLDSVGIPQSNSLAASIEQLMERQRIAQQATKVCGDVSSLLDLPPSTDLLTLSGALEAAVLGAKKVLATVQTDSDSTTRLSALNAQLVQLTDRITRVGGAIERLGSALRTLDDIIERQSLDAANAAVVAATHNVADSIFKRIHVPAEYVVTGDAEIPLRRRDNNSATQLNQVSTGQRAAYALSMFLAMNAQVKMGPKAILLDDPISHIDDLNALSFLDYLRNLVLKSNRQVFFATADEKIAGLFAHKFGFLEGELKTIELTRAVSALK